LPARTLPVTAWTVMHSLGEGDGDEPDGLGLGLRLVLGDGDGLVVAEGDGLADAVVDELGLGLADADEGAVLAGVVAGVVAGEVAGVVAALELGAGLAVLVASAVSWALHELAVAAGAGLAVPIRKAPARPTGMMKSLEITPNAPVMACRLLMDTPSPPWSSPSGSRSLP
jgi:hypothetical protein